MGRNRIIVIKEKIDNRPIDISTLKGIVRNEEIINGRGRKIAKMESRNIAVFSFSLIEVITPYMKKKNNVIPIRVLSVKTVSIHNV
ncbi:MAG: hypothetical protein WBG58_02370 [Ignavibacteriaceae bacterium]